MNIQILLGYTGDDNHMPADLTELSEKRFDYIARLRAQAASVMQKYAHCLCRITWSLLVQETGKYGFILGEINEDSTND